MCAREPKNPSDRYAVAVKNEGTIIKHLSRKLSRVFAVFATGKYTVPSVSVKRASTWNGAEYNTFRNYSL